MIHFLYLVIAAVVIFYAGVITEWSRKNGTRDLEKVIVQLCAESM